MPPGAQTNLLELKIASWSSNGLLELKIASWSSNGLLELHGKYQGFHTYKHRKHRNNSQFENHGKYPGFVENHGKYEAFSKTMVNIERFRKPIVNIDEIHMYIHIYLNPLFFSQFVVCRQPNRSRTMCICIIFAHKYR